MRWPWIAAGVVVGLVGLVWTLQEVNVIKGSDSRPEKRQEDVDH